MSAAHLAMVRGYHSRQGEQIFVPGQGRRQAWVFWCVAGEQFDIYGGPLDQISVQCTAISHTLARSKGSEVIHSRFAE